VRPTYPPALFAWLASQSPSHDLAWDVATGTGQAALPLVAHFQRVFASDRYSGPIEQAPAVDGITWKVEAAEACSLPGESVSLVTVAAGLHWLDLDGFVAQVQRVLRPNGLLAVWTYTITPAHATLRPVFEAYARDVLAPYWSPVMTHVHDGYRDLSLPGEPVPTPEFFAECHLDLRDTLDLMRSWSAAIAYARQNGRDPVASLAPTVQALWAAQVGEPSKRITLRWPLHLRVHRRT
jgi:ubiquinone/menaquinone biosynthesis C-methylase UbiE